MKIHEHLFSDYSTRDRVADYIGTTLAFIFIIIVVLLMITVITIIGIEVASWIWGDNTVIYWIADLIK